MLRPALVLVLLVALCGASTYPLAGTIPGSSNWLECRIIRGWPVSISHFPWQLYLTVGGSGCGASIIHRYWALTAARCVVGFRHSQMLLRAGTSIRGSGGTTHDIVHPFVHENYTGYAHDYDITVILVSTPFILGVNVKAVGLTWYEPGAGIPVTVTGWGTTFLGKPTSTTLMATTVQIVDRNTCDHWYPSRITARMICAGAYKGEKEACHGDTGGPLVYGSTQVGIVSWGKGCGNEGFPGVYTNIANLRSWIRYTTGV